MAIDPESVLGNSIRQHRLALGLSLEELGARASLSKSFLSRVERGRAVPSILTLRRIARAMGVGLTELLADLEEYDERKLVVVRRTGRAEMTGDGTDFGYSYEALAASPGLDSVEPLVVRFTSATKEPKEPFTHEGHEFNYVLSGQVQFVYGETTYVLEEGDSAFYDSSIPHYGLVHEGEEAVILAVIVEG
jgi:transcriptional regulator with XRE-family HTH domain